MTMQSLLGLLACCLSLKSAFTQDYPIDFGPRLCSEDETVTLPKFHMIVCGAGSAGATLAARLSEEVSWNTLLLEKGDDPDQSTDIPLMWARLLKSPLDYQYVSQPDEHYFKGLDGGVSSIPRGKVSGGCSTINVAMYIRGNERDFDDWQANGCVGWNYDSVMKYFLKAEDYQESEHYDTNIHSIGGPLAVSRYRAPDPVIPVLVDGLQEAGLPQLPDLNVRKPVGFSISDSTTRQGLRCSSFKGYMSAAKLRRNLFFARKTTVRKVLFEEGRAVGVEIKAPNGRICNVRAQVEVILSLGAIASPQVLMLSGVGPQQHLKQMGIPCVVNAPVGQNYMDHPIFIGTVFTDRKHRFPENVNFESKRLINDTYKLFTAGVPTMGMTEVVAFLDTSKAGSYPDIELMTMRLSYKTMFQTGNGRHKLYNMFGLSDNTADLFTKLNDLTDTIFLMVILLDTKSTGVIELASTDPEEHPKIDARLMHHADEVETMLKGVRFVEDLAKTDAFREYGLELEHLEYENCIGLEKGSDDYYKCAFQQIVSGFYHPGCSVKMAGEVDESAVLDPRLRVKGVKGLRVIDASSMNRMVSANPNAAVIMMAEKGADMIKEDYEKPIDYKAGLF